MRASPPGQASLSRLTTILFVIAAAGAASAPALAKPRVIPIAGGQVMVDGPPGYETVVVAKKNRRPSESTCDVRSGTYADLSAFFKKFRAAVRAGVNDRRRAQVVALVRFPFRLSSAAPKVYANAAELTAHYDEVFTPDVLKRVAAAEPAVVHCSGGAAMLGDGVVWAHTDAGVTAADTVNQ